MHAYYNAFTKRLKKLADYQINPNMALVSFFMCAKTDEEARRAPTARPSSSSALRFYGALQRPPASAARHRQHVGRIQQVEARQPRAQAAALRGGLIGSPETIRRKLRKFQSSNIDQVILLNQAGKNTHEHICESLNCSPRK